ncbi:exopolysaccharide biosynthesis WecB/TagA/CpsF family protein [Brevundimonas alba]|uniref:Exopolysaccharide biosynthesis WecB/TagA/CpsF family protein n=1 Tax=Brevundimonas alba TaxID=74314 RepID=A0A7X6BN32_9CAUL|nr:WecB/TagA/CpsF family glycosyltransferase [Brevundimonas alba]NJC40026.1 exopolysaccharide biosynthesis WecB/TagA/CpsF family protein [Brevundimonas alba]
MTRFMTLDFADGDRASLLGRVAAMARGPYAWVVTPNVDHVIKLMDGRVEADVYGDADLMICDSRILAHLARLRGKSLAVYPGSDMTADLLASDHDLTIGVFGPDRAAFDDLAARYPARPFTFIDAPMGLTPGTGVWVSAIDEAARADWDVLLACVSFPKQERFAHALRAAGRDHGVTLCVGASVDFLTGRQQRAPRLYQALSLEWLHRLMTQPRRMFRRYVIEGPAIFGLFIRHEVLGQG